nr:DUF4241 domain-containing protein [Aurantimonas sp. CSK15Z-1]
MTALYPSALARRGFGREEVCDLVCPTGRIIGCDPAVGAQSAPAFEVTVPPGRYPAFAYFDEPEPTIETRVALAELRISPRRVVRWSLARRDTPHAYQRNDYDVDSAKGCFCDAAALPHLDLSGLDTEAKEALHEDLMWSIPHGDQLLDPATGLNVAVFDSGAGDGSYRTYVGHDDAGRVARLVTSFRLFEAAWAKASPSQVPAEA